MSKLAKQARREARRAKRATRRQLLEGVAIEVDLDRDSIVLDKEDIDFTVEVTGLFQLLRGFLK